MQYSERDDGLFVYAGKISIPWELFSFSSSLKNLQFFFNILVARLSTSKFNKGFFYIWILYIWPRNRIYYRVHFANYCFFFLIEQLMLYNDLMPSWYFSTFNYSLRRNSRRRQIEVDFCIIFLAKFLKSKLKNTVKIWKSTESNSCILTRSRAETENVGVECISVIIRIWNK